MNNNLDGYELNSQPSKSAAGGVASYTSKSLDVTKRTDLCITDDEFETAVWVEIKKAKLKMFCVAVLIDILHLVQ